MREQNRQDAADPTRYRPGDGLRAVNGLTAGPRRVTADDLDWYAARLAGTFRLLRWHMLFEALRETNPTLPARWLPLIPPNASTLRRAEKIALEYRQFELALERSVGLRPGYNKRLCDSKDTFLNRLGRKMYTPQECYRLQFGIDSDLDHVASYRAAIFPRLFCSSWRLYHERYQQYFTDGLHGRPGPWDRPHNFVFKQIKTWPAVAEPKTPTQLCGAQGGDANGDGICDAWQAALRDALADANNAKCAACPDPQVRPSPPLYASVEEAAWAAGRAASMLTQYTGWEWGGYVYPVPGGFRLLGPVTSKSDTRINMGAHADPAFAALFPKGRPASCRPVAAYHTHPSWWAVRGLSLGDMQNAIQHGRPSYVMSATNLDKLYVFEPGRSKEADELIIDTDPWVPGFETVYELRYNSRFVQTLTRK